MSSISLKSVSTLALSVVNIPKLSCLGEMSDSIFKVFVVRLGRTRYKYLRL